MVCPSCTYPSIIVKETCTHVLDSLLRTTKNWGAAGTCTLADACACARDPFTLDAVFEFDLDDAFECDDLASKR